MSIAVKTDTGWQVLGAGESSGGGSTKWGDWTIVDAPDEADTWSAPDSQGRIWKYVEFNKAGDYTINLTGGMYWVLTVGGGSRGSDANEGTRQGQPGHVNEGFWEFGSGDQPITVGAKGFGKTVGSANVWGKPSSIADFGTQGVSTWGHYNTGRGALAEGDQDGYLSAITGDQFGRQFAPGRLGPANAPGKAGGWTTGDGQETDGCVIIATVDEDKTDYYPPGALPGIGGWATITSVWNGSGTKPNRYAYPAGNPEWVAFEWTDTSTTQTLTTLNGGLVDALIVSGGGTGGTRGGGQGSWMDGIREINASNSVTVGTGGIKGSSPGCSGRSSILGPWTCPESAGEISHPRNTTKVSAIVGEDRTYSVSNSGGDQNGANTGTGGQLAYNGASGVVICRVPAALAAGVDPSEYVDVP
jgi:hypothetical protein